MINIRLAALHDLRVIQDLSYELFKHDAPWISYLNMNWPYETETGEAYFKEVIKGSDRLVCFVAEIDGIIVGYLAGRIKQPETYRKLKLAELENMIVDASHRHRGIGKQLVAAFRDWCLQKGADKIVVVASEPNAQAIKFYKSVGFEPYSLELEMPLRNDN